MAANTGTVTITGVAGEKGQEYSALLTYALGGALSNGDTITWTNAIPSSKAATVVSLEFWAPELDTGASPTGTAIIGDGTTTNGYATTFNLGLPAVSPANGQQIIQFGNGTLIGTNAQASRNIVFTVNGVMATSATTGTIYIRVVCKGI